LRITNPHQPGLVPGHLAAMGLADVTAAVVTAAVVWPK
jgi:hypothetical protein